MSLRVIRAGLEINGKLVTDFKGVTEKSRNIARACHLMYSTASALLTQRYAVSVQYVVPQINPFDFATVQGGTLTIEYDSGDRNTYGGVYTDVIGDASIDGEAELVRTIDFHAESLNGATGA
jgi:hypothetical protein